MVISTASERYNSLETENKFSGVKNAITTTMKGISDVYDRLNNISTTSLKLSYFRKKLEQKSPDFPDSSKLISFLEYYFDEHGGIGDHISAGVCHSDGKLFGYSEILNSLKKRAINEIEAFFNNYYLNNLGNNIDIKYQIKYKDALLEYVEFLANRANQYRTCRRFGRTIKNIIN